MIDLASLADSSIRVIVKGLERVTLTRVVGGEMLAANVAPFED